MTPTEPQYGPVAVYYYIGIGVDIERRTTIMASMSMTYLVVEHETRSREDNEVMPYKTWNIISYDPQFKDKLYAWLKSLDFSGSQIRKVHKDLENHIKKQLVKAGFRKESEVKAPPTKHISAQRNHYAAIARKKGRRITGPQ